MKKIAIYIFSFFFLCLQSNAQDLKNIKVDNLNDDQIKKIVERARQNGLSIQQLESAAIARGMSVTEIEKLRKRIAKIYASNDPKADNNIISLRSYTDSIYYKQKEIRDSLFMNMWMSAIKDTILPKEIFGSYLFRNRVLTFEPSYNFPTPSNYQLGPGDEIVIDIWGASQQNYRLMINPEGYIFIDNVGPIFVNGLTIEKASKLIIGRLSAIYAGLQGTNPNTFAQVNLGNLRSIKVTIVGEVNLPGTYTLSSLASVFNALYIAGGPSDKGSFRNISVIRENKVIAQVDLYDFLIYGKQKDNIRLQDQDVILVKPYVKHIELNGEVKIPAIFELKENETFNDLLMFCGGFTDKAYQHLIKVMRKTDKELSLVELSKENYQTFVMQDGDVVTVEPILKRFINRVEITGAVFRPGIYELTPNLTLRKLVEKAEGLREDAFTGRAIIYRLQKDLNIETIPVDIAKMLEDTSYDISLQREDRVKIFSNLELEEQFEVSIEGEVQIRGKFPYLKNMTLSDLIALAGGFKESASLSRIEIARRIKSQHYDEKSRQIAIIKLFNVSRNLTLDDSASKFILEPYDKIIVRRSPSYEIQQNVYVVGEVFFPGIYIIQSKNERISEIIRRAGGLTSEAYPKGARLYRQLTDNRQFRAKLIRAIEHVTIEDSVQLAVSMEKEQFIGIDLVEILKNPGSENDLLLMDGDRIEIPKRLETVRLSGALLFPITVRYTEGMNLKKYTKMAGGTSPNALLSKAFVIYPSGKVKTTSTFLGLRFYPRIEPGSEIIIPKKAEKKDRMTTQETIAMATSISSLSIMIVTLINLLKK